MKVTVENASGFHANGWTTCGLPDPVDTPTWYWAKTDRYLPTLAIGHRLHTRVDLPPHTRRTIELEPMNAANAAAQRFEFSPWVSDEILRLLQGFECDGLRSNRMEFSHVTADFVRIVEDNGARTVFHFRTRIPAIPLVIEGWLYTYSGQEIVEYEIRTCYGTAAPGQLRERVLGPVSMLLGEEPVLDYMQPKGLHAPVLEPDGAGSYRWRAEIAAAGQWFRARTVEVTGALLCLPPLSQIGQHVTDPRIANMKHRREIPLTSIADGWEGKWGAFGVIPTKPRDAVTEQQQRFWAMVGRLGRTGNEYDPRRYAPPPQSGTTGEQDDFGASRGEHAIAMNEPWAVWDLRFAVQAWMLRPYANREPDGSPVLAVNHPRARLWNRTPWEQVGTADMLGWPNPVGYINGYNGSDRQHRSDNLLHAMFALTRSYSIERTIRDILECDKMEVGWMSGSVPALGSGVGSPRGWGRPLVSNCHALRNGFFDYSPEAHRMVRHAWLAASFRRLPSTAQVRVLSDKEAKNGWLHATAGNPGVRCWLPWQEAIAIMGFYAAYRAIGQPEARELCIIPAKTIAKYAFFKVGSNWHCCYGVRWRTDVEGAPLPPESYRLGRPNEDIWAGEVTISWVLPALQILLELDPQCQEADRAREILTHYGQPANWRDACWRAVTR